MNLTLFHLIGCSFIVDSKGVDAGSGEGYFSVAVAEAAFSRRRY